MPKGVYVNNLTLYKYIYTKRLYKQFNELPIIDYLPLLVSVYSMGYYNGTYSKCAMTKPAIFFVLYQWTKLISDYSFNALFNYLLIK